MSRYIASSGNRDTARLHGGDITAGPNPAGRGTRFEAEFPALREEGAV